MIPRLRLVRELRRLFARPPAAAREGGEELERQLLGRHRVLYGARADARRRRRPHRGVRLAWAGGTVLLVLGVVAEAVPSEDSIPVGTLLTWQVESSEELPPIAALVERLEAVAAAEEVSVSVQEGPGGGARLHVILLGERRPAAEVAARLSDRFPVLGARVAREETLSGSVRSSLARVLGRRLLSIEIGEADLEQARRAVRAELAARGLPVSRVEIRREGERRELRIELQGEE